MIFGPNKKNTFTTEEHFAGAGVDQNTGGEPTGKPGKRKKFSAAKMGRNMVIILLALVVWALNRAGLPVKLNADVGQIGSYVCIGLAIPLLMFGTNLADVRRLAKPVLLSFALLLLAVSAVAVLLGRTRGALFPWGRHLAAMAAGMYTGGSPNFNAVGVILGVPGDTIAVGNLSDMIVGTVFYIFILTLAKPLCARVLDRRAKQGGYMRESGGAENVGAPCSSPSCSAAPRSRACSSARSSAL